MDHDSNMTMAEDAYEECVGDFPLHRLICLRQAPRQILPEKNQKTIDVFKNVQCGNFAHRIPQHYDPRGHHSSKIMPKLAFFRGYLGNFCDVFLRWWYRRRIRLKANNRPPCAAASLAAHSRTRPEPNSIYAIEIYSKNDKKNAKKENFQQKYNEKTNM
jgi:hypothetical protein